MKEKGIINKNKSPACVLYAMLIAQTVVTSSSPSRSLRLISASGCSYYRLCGLSPWSVVEITCIVPAETVPRSCSEWIRYAARCSIKLFVVPELDLWSA